MTEFVLVTFPIMRRVRVDGVRLGQTGQVLRLETGHHIFDLGNPRDYAPPNVQTPVVNTTETTPMVIAFDVAEVGFPEAVVPAPPPPPAARRKSVARRKKSAKKTAARKPKASAAKGGRRKAAAKGGRRKVR